MAANTWKVPDQDLGLGQDLYLDRVQDPDHYLDLDLDQEAPVHQRP